MEPVDFAIWQAADGTWQIWSCVRKAKLAKGTRLFHRWEGKNLTDTNWKAMGIAMQSEEKYGELRRDSSYPMFLRMKASSLCSMVIESAFAKPKARMEKHSRRVIQKNGKTGMFANGPKEINTRDPMVIKIGDTCLLLHGPS